MKRREFIKMIAGSAATWPLAARAQQPAMPVVGLLSAADQGAGTLDAVRQGLKEAGYVEGHNVAIEYRLANGQYDRVPAMAADLVGRQVAVIVTIGGTVSATAAKAATTTIPVVFSNGADPVKLGLVASLNRPAGNLTGVSFLANALGAKRVALLHELIPAATSIGLLVNPANPSSESETKDLQAAAAALRLQAHVVNASSEHEIDAAFATLVQQRVNALAITADVFFTSRRDQLVALAARYLVPTIYTLRVYTTAGGLMSYGTDIAEANRLAGVYAGRILKGAKPAELPVQQSTKFEFVINMKTAKALGLSVPNSMQLIADEVIE